MYILQTIRSVEEMCDESQDSVSWFCCDGDEEEELSTEVECDDVLISLKSEEEFVSFVVEVIGYLVCECGVTRLIHHWEFGFIMCCLTILDTFDFFGDHIMLVRSVNSVIHPGVEKFIWI